MDHSAALCDTAYTAFYAVNLEFKCYFLWASICGHYTLAREITMIAQALYQCWNSVCDGLNIQGLSYNTC